MTLVLITGAAAFPISLVEAKAHLKASEDDDDLITSLITAATAYAERNTGTALAPQTWEYVEDAFPADEIEITLGPIVSITSIKYLDADGVLQTIDSGDYSFDDASLTGRIVPALAWPTPQETINAVKVRFVVGSTCPVDVRHAILMLIGHWYDNRASVSDDGATEVPMATTMILDLHRRMFV